MLDHGLDQAAGLRNFMAAAPLNVLAFPLRAAAQQQAWIAQIARGLRAIGRKPVVLDAARGAVMPALGLPARPRHELIDMLQGNRDFDEVASATADGVWALRADRGVEAFAGSGAPASQLLDGFSRLSHGFDELLLAMPTSELACLAVPWSSVPVIGLDPGPVGLVHAYTSVKQLCEGFGYARFACVVTGADRATAAREHERLASAASRFLGCEVGLAGHLPAPGAVHARHVERVAHALLQLAAAPPARGH